MDYLRCYLPLEVIQHILDYRILLSAPVLATTPTLGEIATYNADYDSVFIMYLYDRDTPDALCCVRWYGPNIEHVYDVELPSFPNPRYKMTTTKLNRTLDQDLATLPEGYIESNDEDYGVNEYVVDPRLAYSAYYARFQSIGIQPRTLRQISIIYTQQYIITFLESTSSRPNIAYTYRLVYLFQILYALPIFGDVKSDDELSQRSTNNPQSLYGGHGRQLHSDLPWFTLGIEATHEIYTKLLEVVITAITAMR
jgi:hypothetical protein